MTRDELEAAIWAVTGRQLTGEAVDAIVAAAEEYASGRLPHPHASARHTSGTDLYPVIGVLADALMNPAPQAVR